MTPTADGPGTATPGTLSTHPQPAKPALSAETGFNPGAAHPARVYSYWLGGKDHFPADRIAAQQVMRERPQVVAGARANRAFLARVGVTWPPTVGSASSSISDRACPR
jgi:S-adenosyl methyltransferase